jgi:sialate O-acetylesterase
MYPLTLFKYYFFLICASAAVAEVTLPRIFGDHMVIQRDEPIAVWGQATSDEHVEVSLNGVIAKAVADAQGHWELELPAQSAGGPFNLKVNDRVLEDVYLGDVWVLSGQSNAQVSFNYYLGLSISPEYLNRFKTDLKNCADETLIRNYMVACKNDKKETIRNESENRWFASNPTDIGEVNPIAYYFAREISRKTSVMTAVIRIAWGGHHIETFYAGAYIYRNMLQPWSRVKIKGVIWYQGENNLYKEGDRLGYALKLQLLIRDYRKLWGNPQLPFLVVQMPPSTYSSRPFNDLQSLPVFLEAQRQALQIPFTSMAVASDLGMANGLHQPQKHALAVRLANLALANVYQDSSSIPAGPQLQQFEIRGNQVIASFDTFGSELITSDGLMPRYFEIAALKQDFKPAQTKIEGNTIVLWNDGIEKPYDVRYGFDENVLMKLNLTNSEGIPAAVFWARAQNQLHPGLLDEMKQEALFEPDGE